MSYGWPATSLGLNPYGNSPYPSNALAPLSGPNPYAPSQPSSQPPPQPIVQAPYPQSPYDFQTGSTHTHRQLTRKEKIAIIIGSVLGGSALIVALALIVKHYRKPPQRIESGAMTYGQEGGAYLQQGGTRGEYQVKYFTPEEMTRRRYAQKLRAHADEYLDSDFDYMGAVDVDGKYVDGDKVLGKILNHYASSPHREMEALRPANLAFGRRKTIEHYVKQFVRSNPGDIVDKSPEELFELFRQQGFHAKVEETIYSGKHHFAPGSVTFLRGKARHAARAIGIKA